MDPLIPLPRVVVPPAASLTDGQLFLTNLAKRPGVSSVPSERPPSASANNNINSHPSASSCYKCFYEHDLLAILEEDLWDDFLQVLAQASGIRCVVLFGISLTALRRHNLRYDEYLTCLQRLGSVLQQIQVPEVKIWHYGEPHHLYRIVAALLSSSDNHDETTRSALGKHIERLEIMDLLQTTTTTTRAPNPNPRHGVAPQAPPQAEPSTARELQTSSYVLANVLVGLPRLQSLSLINLPCILMREEETESSSVIFQAVATCPNLREFIYCAANTTNHTSRRVVKPTALFHADNNKSMSAHWLHQILSMPSLKEVRLCSMDLNDGDLQVLAKTLQRTDGPQSSTATMAVNIPSESSLDHMASLDSLFMKNVQFSQEGAVCLMQALETTESLHQLDLYDCHSLVRRRQVLKAMIQAAKRNFQLTIHVKLEEEDEGETDTHTNDNDELEFDAGNSRQRPLNNRHTARFKTVSRQTLENEKLEDLFRSIAKMNKVGRKYITHDPGCKEKGVTVLDSMTNNLDALFLHLEENPLLCQRQEAERRS